MVATEWGSLPHGNSPLKTHGRIRSITKDLLGDGQEIISVFTKKEKQ
jgi:hypothetical protein